jgi:O-antigen ligase
VLLPRPAGEGTKLERTSSVNAKYVNYKEGFSLFQKSPVFGFGYNNLPIIRPNASHSQSGFDSSLLTILTTTGVIGTILFILGLSQLFIKSNLAVQTMIIAILVHSLFSNSLLYPFTLLFLVLI